MKKILSVCAAICLTAGCLCGCGESGDTTNQNNGEVAQAETTTTEAETTTTTTTTSETTTTTAAEKQINFTDAFKDISFFYIGTDSVGAIEYSLLLPYTGDKQIKYVTVSYYMLNSVKDPIEDEIKGDSKFVKKISGPIDKNGYIVDLQGFTTPCEIYCRNCFYLGLERIELEYMDGNKEYVEFTSDANCERLQTSTDEKDLMLMWNAVYSYNEEHFPDYK